MRLPARRNYAGFARWGRYSKRAASSLLPRDGSGFPVVSLEQVAHLQIDTIGPAEADGVALVSGGNFYVGGAADRVVLFADGAVAQKILQNGLRKLVRCA